MHPATGRVQLDHVMLNLADIQTNKHLVLGLPANRGPAAELLLQLDGDPSADRSAITCLGEQFAEPPSDGVLVPINVDQLVAAGCATHQGHRCPPYAERRCDGLQDGLCSPSLHCAGCNRYHQSRSSDTVVSAADR
ncbi:hypothetical protein [Streptomyces sp. SID13031]|uniref:hypothetical protein n=1 Tax=Streptomyces sp. SID13031 TaxID=2706046 RepID=UPI001EF16866|nr:hypothetical protein [Streptomyces sp. SID13031]